MKEKTLSGISYSCAFESDERNRSGRHPVIQDCLWKWSLCPISLPPIALSIFRCFYDSCIELSSFLSLTVVQSAMLFHFLLDKIVVRHNVFFFSLSFSSHLSLIVIELFYHTFYYVVLFVILYTLLSTPVAVI